MKTYIKLSVLILSGFILASCSDQVTGSNTSSTTTELSKLDSFTPGELSPEEEAGIIYMRQEEKLARDVYTILAQTWNVAVFENIISSEQNHMDAVLRLITRYNLVDPVENDEVGVFSDPGFQQLFNDFVQQGQQSLTEALLVGQTIEQQDISYLEYQLSFVDNPDLVKVYSNLKTASEKHLYSFTNHFCTTY
jgi:hypothetical protein